jgi:hypothetical protein
MRFDPLVAVMATLFEHIQAISEETAAHSPLDLEHVKPKTPHDAAGVLLCLGSSAMHSLRLSHRVRNRTGSTFHAAPRKVAVRLPSSLLSDLGHPGSFRPDAREPGHSGTVLSQRDGSWPKER